MTIIELTGYNYLWLNGKCSGLLPVVDSVTNSCLQSHLRKRSRFSGEKLQAAAPGDAVLNRAVECHSLPSSVS